ncbi:hypothetical protein, partial [Rhodopirellula sallentina]|uniref:hypothetical protein n=1 Tax=Rhodopirellula sallentina TaxID=1263869 RepID=UPI001F337113
MPDDSQSTSAVVGENVAEDLELSIGDEIMVTSFGNRVALTIIGIVEQAPE